MHDGGPVTNMSLSLSRFPVAGALRWNVRVSALRAAVDHTFRHFDIEDTGHVHLDVRGICDPCTTNNHITSPTPTIS